MLTGAVHGAGGDPQDAAAAGADRTATERDPPRENLRVRLRERGVS